MQQRPLTLRISAALFIGLWLCALHVSAHAEPSTPDAGANRLRTDSVQENSPAPLNNEDAQASWNAKKNVETAYLAAQSSAYGQALLHLERARYLRPFDLEIREGLDLVRQQIQRNRMNLFRHVQLTQGEPDGLWWWRAFNVLPTRIWAAGSLVTLWIAFLLWLVLRRMRTSVPKDAFATTAVLSLVLSIMSSMGWAGATYTMQNLEPGVIVDTQPHLFHAPDELSTPKQHPDLYEGAVVLIRNRSAGWTEVELAGRERIWVKHATVAPIEPALNHPR